MYPYIRGFVVLGVCYFGAFRVLCLCFFVVGVGFFLGYMGFLVGGFFWVLCFIVKVVCLVEEQKKGENWICFLVNIAKGLHYGL